VHRQVSLRGGSSSTPWATTPIKCDLCYDPGHPRPRTGVRGGLSGRRPALWREGDSCSWHAEPRARS
jgi:hypothetical protein